MSMTTGFTTEHVCEMIRVSLILTSGLEFEHGNVIRFSGIVLSSLWYLSIRIRIGLSVVWFKCVFHVCTDPFR